MNNEEGRYKLKFLIDSKHGLGDCVQIIPMLEIIKENYPDSYLAVIVNNKASKELLQLSPVKIDKFYYLDMSKMTMRKFLTLILDCVINLSIILSCRQLPQNGKQNVSQC